MKRLTHLKTLNQTQKYKKITILYTKQNMNNSPDVQVLRMRGI
jgi:hypothetical protein